jgi:phage gp45-like
LRNADAVEASELTEVCVGALVFAADWEVERDVVTNAEYGLLSAACAGEIELVAIIFSTGGSRSVGIG